MAYDSDKTHEMMHQLRAALNNGDLRAAIQLLRHADAGGRLRADRGLLPRLREAVGDGNAVRIISALAFEACPYCQGGREECEDCDGKGYDEAHEFCPLCAGLGVRRCPFCNGAAFAGYDFVPWGLRPSVVKARLGFVSNRLDALSDAGVLEAAAPEALVRHILVLDQLRGVLANSVEFVGTQAPGAPGARSVYSDAGRASLLKNCREANERAEVAIRDALRALAEYYGGRAEAAGVDDRKRALYAHRAKHFLRLSGGKGLGGSALATPRSFGKPE